MATQADLLSVLSRHHVASISQLSVLLSTSPQMVRRWVRQAGDAVRVTGGIANRGRPEQWVNLKGFHGKNQLHDWHVTGVSVEVMNASTPASGFSHRFIPAAFDGTVPDLCFFLTRGGKSCLFFVEVDCGTEPITRKGDGTELTEKLRRYVELRATNRYLAVVDGTGLTCHGFRVLLVTLAPARLAQACRLARSLPGDLVWVSTWSEIGSSGAAGHVWSRGGRANSAESIFYSSMRK